MMPRFRSIESLLLAAGSAGSLIAGSASWAPLPLFAGATAAEMVSRRRAHLSGNRGIRTGPASSVFPSVRSIAAILLLLAPIGIGYLFRLHHFTYGPLKFELDERRRAAFIAPILLLLGAVGGRSLFRRIPAVLNRALGGRRIGEIAAIVFLFLPLSRWAWGGESADSPAALARTTILLLVLATARALAWRGHDATGAALLTAVYLLTISFLAGDPDANHRSAGQIVGGGASWAARLAGAAFSLASTFLFPTRPKRA